jgi:hypothetical protein
MANLFRQLQDQWDHDAQSAEARAALRRWAERDPDLTRFANPAELVRTCNDRADRVARHSVDRLTEVASSDPWAVRTVLQALLPGLASLARQHGDMVGQAREPFDTIDELDQFLVCTAFERITEVGAEVEHFRMRTVLDSTWSRLRAHAGAHRRDHRMKVPIHDGAAVAAPPPRTEAEELAATLIDAVDRNVLRPLDAGLVYTTRVVGRSAAELADSLDWHLDAVYRRRHRAQAVVVADELGLPRPRQAVRAVAALA